LTFTDVAGVQAGRGCEQVDAVTVACRGIFSYASVIVDLGDQDDGMSTHVASPDAEPLFALDASGGAGNDVLDLRADEGVTAGTLQGGDGNDLIFGGVDHDRLRGGDGNDVLDGSRGADELDGGFGDDELIGGADRDRVTYGARVDPIRVDLADALPDGGAGEADTISGVESVAGGRGSDVLRGTSGPDELAAASGLQPGEYVGGDILYGRGGDDILWGSSKPDELRGGAGDDRLRGDKSADFLRGGSGDDYLDANHGGDRLHGGGGDDQLIPGRPGRRRDRLACGDGVDFAGVGRESQPPVIKPACERFNAGVSVTKWSFSDGVLELQAREYGFVCRVTFRAGGNVATRVLRPRGHRPIRFRVKRRRVLVRAAGPCGKGRFPLRARFLLSQ